MWASQIEKRRTAGWAVGLVAAASLLGAAQAHAEPSGCSSNVSGSTSSIGQLRATATGSCTGSATRTLRVEIKQDIKFQSDPVLAANSQVATTTKYSVPTASCDGGQTAVYYGVGFFTSSPTYHETPHTTQHTCA